jgi:hypothetical protein
VPLLALRASAPEPLLSESRTLANHADYSQTVISCQGLTTQRDPSIFPEPETFNPQQWLDAESLGTLETMREQFMVFGKGARACLGRKLAMMELKCTTAGMSAGYALPQETCVTGSLSVRWRGH